MVKGPPHAVPANIYSTVLDDGTDCNSNKGFGDWVHDDNSQVWRMTPNDHKLSDGGGWRGPCMAGGKAAAEARAVTAGAVRCSAYGLSVAAVVIWAWH